MKAGEGMGEVTGGRVWYGVVGSSDATPLLVLHGGPEFTHEYMRSLDALAHERPIVVYDPEYMAAMLVYYKRHVCRLDPWPVEVERAFQTYGPGAR